MTVKDRRRALDSSSDKPTSWRGTLLVASRSSLRASNQLRASASPSRFLPPLILPVFFPLLFSQILWTRFALAEHKLSSENGTLEIIVQRSWDYDGAVASQTLRSSTLFRSVLRILCELQFSNYWTLLCALLFSFFSSLSFLHYKCIYSLINLYDINFDLLIAFLSFFCRESQTVIR